MAAIYLAIYIISDKILIMEAKFKSLALRTKLLITLIMIVIITIIILVVIEILY
ncbi:MAG: hypothetical protein PHN39_02540 [Candidatus Pacebacteria bacterium]|nr:hypothetical protein [Candidatus Paceibacterota bacterium]